jgi:cobalt-zinc-cadmium efflux system protein
VGHEHEHGAAPGADRRWLIVALGLLLIFLVGEVVAGLLAHSTALLTDAAHLLTDVVSLATALVAVQIAARPPRGAFTFGFSRVDALAGQANGITLLLLAVWFVVQAGRDLLHPADASGSVMTVVALVGVAVNVLATAAAMKAQNANEQRLSVRGAVAHLVNDLWAFAATAVAGVIIIVSGWTRADAIASLVIAALMIYTGVGLIRAAGRVFLEAAPREVDPLAVGTSLAAVDGVAQIHDLHVWQIGPGESAVSAHVLVVPERGCHEIGATMRQLLADRFGLSHATLQLDHVGVSEDGHSVEHICSDTHGPVHTAT